MSDALAWVGAFGGMIGALGGVAGVLAYLDQHESQKRADAIAHIDPTLRPLLLRIVAVGLDIEGRHRDQDWIKENVGQLEREFRPLGHVSIAAIRGDFTDFASVGLYLKKLLLEDYSDGSQGYMGHRLTDAATVLLHRISGTTSAVGPTNPALPDDMDMPPRPIQRRGLRRLLPHRS